MAKLVCQTAILKCTQGLSPSKLTVLTNQTVLVSGKPAATINDFASEVCVASFGMCQSASNPAVIAAKAAGSPTAPCVPLIVAPWAEGSTKVMVQKQIALNNTSKAICTLGGNITINFPAQEQVNIP